METSENEGGVKPENIASEQPIQQCSVVPGEWRYRFQSIDTVPSSTSAISVSSFPVTSAPSYSASVVETCNPNFWTNSTVSPNFGFSPSTVPDCVLDGKAAPLSSRSLLLAPSMTGMIPNDPAFVERAARLSSFGVRGFSGMVSPFAPPSGPMPAFDSSNTEAKDRSKSGSPRDKNPNDEANMTESSREEELNSNKRKRIIQGIELGRVEIAKDETENREKMDQSDSKANGKQVKNSSESAKEGYIHVRARRGQATNSHSLAERVRREKISERMKYLQDLVPGCSKVTGKAVMLDEIINYVQSLQRQVEFLSMKLAAVNPRLDFNVEGLLSGDILHSRVAPSSAMRFSTDNIHPQFHLPQHNLTQPGIAGMANHSDAFRKMMNIQLSSFKEPMLQMHGHWDEDMQNVMQASYGANPSVNSQELNNQWQNC